MPKNTIEITPEMERVLNKVRYVTGKKLTNEKAIEQALLMLDKKIEI